MSTNRNSDTDENISRDDLSGPKIDRRTAMKLIGMGGVVSLSGCLGGGGNDGGNETTPGDTSQGDDGNDGETPAQKSGGEITYAIPTGQISSLDPITAIWLGPLQNVFNSLLKFNDNNEIVGDLASDWSVPNDTTFEFQLHEGVTFHNGDTLDSEAVKWSINRMKTDEASVYSGLARPIDNIETPDSTTVRLNLAHPFAPLPALMTRERNAYCITNQTAVENDAEKYRRQPVGSGPFKISGRETGEYIQLEKFDDYWETDEGGNSLPYLDGVRIRLLPEPSTQWSGIRAGDIHYVQQLAPEYANQAGRAQNIVAEGRVGGSWHGLAQLSNKPHNVAEEIEAMGQGPPTDKWRDKDLPTANRKVRRAVAKALNREAIVNRGRLGWAQPAHSVINPSMGEFYKEEPEPGHYHAPDEARQLLDEAGYTGDPRFSGRILVQPKDERPAIVAQQNLRNVGIEVEVDTQQPSSYWSNIYKFEHMWTFYGGDGNVDPYQAMWRQLATPTGEGSKGVWQKNLWFNEEFDQVLSESNRTMDSEKRQELVWEANNIFIEDAGYAMTEFPEKALVRNSNLKGVIAPTAVPEFTHAWLDS